jgi:hypothetical protein
VVVNRGIPVDRVAAATHAQIRTVAIRDSSATAGRRTSTRGMENGTPVVYRPQLRNPSTPVNVVAQKIDERHPMIQHSTIAAVRTAPTQVFTAPRSPIGSSRPVPGSELERRSSAPGQSVPRSEIERRSSPGQPMPRTYQQTAPVTPAGPARIQDATPARRSDSRGREVPRVNSSERSADSHPIIRADSR